MATYIVPQALVYQEFELIPTEITTPLRAFICGPNYSVKKYGVGQDEQIKLGQYASTLETAYNWPNRVAGSVVDESFTRLFVKSALLRYFVSSGDTITPVAVNKISTDGDAFDSGEFPFTRPVRVGDVVKVSGIVDDATVEAWSYVTAVEASIDPAVVPAVATAASTNAADAADATAEVDGIPTGAFVGYDEVLDGSTYLGCEAGYPVETYTAIVAADSEFTGAEDVIFFDVISASGTDNLYDHSITFGEDLTLGRRGLVMPIPDGSYTAGDRISITVTQLYAAPVVTMVGTTYTGTRDTSYIIDVLSGSDGGAENTATLRVRTNNGYDGGSSVIAVIDANFGAATGTAIPLGNYGLSFFFKIAASTQLVKGDSWTVAVTAAAPGDKDTLVLANNLPASLLGAALDTPAGVFPTLTMSLYMKKDMEIPQTNADSTVNWSTSPTQITVAAGITGYDSEVLDALGAPLEMNIESSTINTVVNVLYVQYRSLLQTKAGDVYSISDIGEIPAQLGDISADNPLALAVSLALSNANGTTVRYSAVATDDVAGYTAVLSNLSERSDVYGLVPLSKDPTVQALFAGHAGNMSSAENGRWRITFLNSDATESYAVVDSPVDDEKEATITAVNNENLMVTWTVGIPTGGGFITSGVAAGDILRVNYDVDGTYEEYVIDSVLSETRVRLMAGPAAASETALKFEVWHNNTKNEIAADYAMKSGSFGSRRVYHIWPDKINYGTQLIDGYFAAAAVAGLVSGVAPQQGLTNLAITGFSGVSRTTSYFGAEHLNTMAEGGTFIITQDPVSGAIYARHQLSTDSTDLNSRELSVVKNVDSISYVFQSRLSPYIGISNVTPSLLDRLRVDIIGVKNFLMGNGVLARIGGQLINATIVELRQHSVLHDRIIVVLDLEVPYPLNNIEVQLVI